MDSLPSEPIGRHLTLIIMMQGGAGKGILDCLSKITISRFGDLKIEITLLA